MKRSTLDMTSIAAGTVMATGYLVLGIATGNPVTGRQIFIAIIGGIFVYAALRWARTQRSQ